MTERLFTTFYVGDTYFGVDATDVQEVLRTQPMTAVPLSSPELSGLINLRGQIVVAIDLRERLGASDKGRGVDRLNVVVRTDEGPVALVIDEIGEVLEVSDEDLETPPETLSEPTRGLVTAVQKLDGKLMLVLDVAATAKPSDRPQQGRHEASAG